MKKKMLFPIKNILPHILRTANKTIIKKLPKVNEMDEIIILIKKDYEFFELSWFGLLKIPYLGGLIEFRNTPVYGRPVRQTRYTDCSHPKMM